jgi:hypothetical protein
MDLDAIDDDTLHRHLAGRTPWRLDPPDPSPATCPGCGAPLGHDPARPDDPDWFIGTSHAARCREEVVLFRRFEGSPDRRGTTTMPGVPGRFAAGLSRMASI